jgi:hypothetical protein
MESAFRSHRQTAVLPAVLFIAWFCQLAAVPSLALGRNGAIVVKGPGARPQIGFACCDQGLEHMQKLFADPAVMSSLSALHAEVAVAIVDFSPQRSEIVQRLNRAGVLVIAWIELPEDEGIYLNADNAPEAAARIATFEKWTSDNHLQWTAVGLDIEPSFSEFAALKGHRARLFLTLLRQSINFGRMRRAKTEYSALIREIQSRGYPVQTYQMPYLPAERSVGTALIDRMLGTVDVRGNEEYLMLFTNNARWADAGMLWSLGRSAQFISIGSTIGPGTPGIGAGPLNWSEFSRDLIVVSHFTRHIGVYDLEGCVQQGFLPRLASMDWKQSVVIPAQSVAKAERLGLIIRSVLWIASHILWLILAVLVLLVWLVWLWRRRRLTRNLQE